MRCTSTPIAAAAAGSSREARLSSPNRLRTSRYTPATQTTITARATQYVSAWRTNGAIADSCCNPAPVAPPSQPCVVTYRNRHSATTQLATAKYPPVSGRSSRKIPAAASPAATAASGIAANGFTPARPIR